MKDHERLREIIVNSEANVDESRILISDILSSGFLHESGILERVEICKYCRGNCACLNCGNKGIVLKKEEK